jgi:D-arginine dehydrogenase
MKADIAIVGAGFAGAAAAYFLARELGAGVVLLEREPAAGAHASGRNAALIRQALEDPLLADAAAEGAAFWRAPPEDVAGGRALFARTGSLLLAGRAQADALARAAPRAGARRIAADEAVRLAPRLAGARFEAALHAPGDGIADVHAALEGFLAAARARGARVLTGCEALGLEVAGGRVAGLRTSRGAVATPAVLDAGGAWAGGLARAAGAAGPPLAPYRRHLFATGAAPHAADEPWVWDVAHGLYFRREGPGYLLSACDEDPHPPGAPVASPAAREDLAQKVAEHLPAFGTAEIARAWACLRTFAPDRRFVLGPDPEIPGLFYAAGLGGHGVTTAAVVGALAARAVLDLGAAPPAFAAARFAQRGPAPRVS